MSNESNIKMTEADLRRQIIECGRRLAGHRLIVAAEGNISARINAERILITPTGARKGSLIADELIVVGPAGTRLDSTKGKPTSELGMHLSVYQKRPDVAACLHAHPPYAVACSVAGVSLSKPVLPEIVVAVGGIAAAEYATPSTQEVADSISPLVINNEAIILKNHGVLTLGPDLETALRRMEMVEHLAQVVFLASQIGRIDHLTAEQVEKMCRTTDRENKAPESDR